MSEICTNRENSEISTSKTDSELKYGAQIRHTTDKAEETATDLSRLVVNVEGPIERRCTC